MPTLTNNRTFSSIGHDSALLLRPMAYLKLLYFCHAATTEIAAFGVSSASDLLMVEDIVLIPQRSSVVTVAFDDGAVADHFDAMAENGIPPARCGRIWIHTHPGDSAAPSSVDEQTFAMSFGQCDWSVMAILARGGASYARMQFPAGPGGQTLLQMQMDVASLPAWLEENRLQLPMLIESWQQELSRCVVHETLPFWGVDPLDSPQDDELQAASPWQPPSDRPAWCDVEELEWELWQELEGINHA